MSGDQTISKPNFDSNAIMEEFEGDDAKRPTNTALEMKPPDVYEWRIDLSKTEQYWTEWFEGLSAKFLEVPVQGKLLLLAGVDRLDKTLLIGQMQGMRFTSKLGS